MDLKLLSADFSVSQQITADDVSRPDTPTEQIEVAFDMLSEQVPGVPLPGA